MRLFLSSGSPLNSRQIRAIMANYSTTSQINLQVNARQASKMFDNLKKEAVDLRRKIDEAAKAGDKVQLRNLHRQLKENQRLMDQMTSDTRKAADVMQRLDKSSPRELKKTLATLSRQLNSIERGSAAWDAQVEKIRKVRSEIRQINSEISAQHGGGMFGRMRASVSDWTARGAAAVAAMTGITAASKAAVDRYAQMQQEEANVKKYAGMSDRQVESVNEEFKKIDTRTSRDGLNRLAQEAGRLGKTSEKEVLGFVRAADQLNVALDDLGDGATQTLSKLTGIFGDEKRLGTERSLLAVGSVINELSQNCTASAPYLAEFSKRLAGVGAQANMTIPQIMSYAAVLDSQGQNVEAASTALSQLIVKMYQNPAKIAKAAGMEVKSFSELVSKDANAALLQLLETLGKYGGMKALSTIFKDMGADGARSTQTIAALAGNVSMVRWEQEEANKAFREATSVTKEFNVQNTTVQAGLEKSRKRIDENGVAIGQRLTPLVVKAQDATADALGVIRTMIDFFKENRSVIVSAAAAWGFYRLAVARAAIEEKIAIAATATWNGIQKTRNILALAYSATMNRLTGNLTRAAAAQKMLNASTSRSLWGAVATAAGLAVGALIQYTQRLRDTARQEKETAEARKKARREAGDWQTKAVDAYGEEISRLKALYKAATDETASRKERIAAAKELQKIYPSTFSQISAENIALGKAKKAYDSLTKSIILNAKAKAAAELVQENEKKILELETELDKNRERYSEASTERNQIRERNRKASERDIELARQGARLGYADRESTADADRKVSEAAADIRQNKMDIHDLKQTNRKITLRFSNNPSFRKELGTGQQGTPEVPEDPITAPESQSAAKAAERERKKREAEERRRQQKEKAEFKAGLDEIKGERDKMMAKNRALRQTGQIDHRQYLEAQEKAETDFYDRSLRYYEKHNLKEDDDYAALLKKKGEMLDRYLKKEFALSVEATRRIADAEEREARAEFAAKEKTTLADELALQTRILNIRYNSLKTQQSLYDAGSEEFERLEDEIRQLLDTDKIDRQKKLADKASEFARKYDTMSAEDRFKIEKAALDRLYAEKYISESRYQEWLRKLKEESLPGSRPEKDSDKVRKAHSDDASSLKAALEAGDISEEEFTIRMRRIKQTLIEGLAEPLKNCQSEWVALMTTMVTSWSDFADELKDPDGDPLGKLQTGIRATAAVMSAVMGSITELTKAETDIQIKEIERRYDREAAFAEGNSYLTRKLEKEKEEEIARIKSEASEKEFAMQVAATVAQTAANAVEAYGAGLSVGGPAGLILAPVAAALAVAQGAIQIAVLKKQQQAAAASGYESGGFTMDGPADRPAGIVHAGEWVAPQRMVRDPRIRPVINLLEQARRGNRIGFMAADDVSRSITAPMVLAGEKTRRTEKESVPAVVVDRDPALTRVLKRLADRLDRPFVTQNRVTGPGGIKDAWDEYDRLIRNKDKKR